MGLDHGFFFFCLLGFVTSPRIYSKWGICLGNEGKVILSSSTKLSWAGGSKGVVCEESTFSCFVNVAERADSWLGFL